MSRIWIAPVGSMWPGPGWRDLGLTSVQFDFAPDPAAGERARELADAMRGGTITVTSKVTRANMRRLDRLLCPGFRAHQAGQRRMATAMRRVQRRAARRR